MKKSTITMVKFRVAIDFLQIILSALPVCLALYIMIYHEETLEFLQRGPYTNKGLLTTATANIANIALSYTNTRFWKIAKRDDSDLNEMDKKKEFKNIFSSLRTWDVLQAATLTITFVLSTTALMNTEPTMNFLTGLFSVLTFMLATLKSEKTYIFYHKYVKFEIGKYSEKCPDAVLEFRG